MQRQMDALNAASSALTVLLVTCFVVKIATSVFAKARAKCRVSVSQRDSSQGVMHHVRSASVELMSAVGRALRPSRRSRRRSSVQELGARESGQEAGGDGGVQMASRLGGISEQPRVQA